MQHTDDITPLQLSSDDDSGAPRNTCTVNCSQMCKKWRNELCRRCVDDQRRPYPIVWKYCALLLLGLVLVLPGVILRFWVKRHEEADVQDGLFSVWLIYFGCVVFVYIAAKVVAWGIFLVLKKWLLLCGRFAKGFMFYIANLRSTFQEVITISLGWSLGETVFGIVTENISWLENTWTTLLALSLLNGARLVLGKLILARLEKTTYQQKVDDYLKHLISLKALTYPVANEVLQKRAEDPSWQLDTDSTKLLAKEASLVDKINYVNSEEFRLFDENGRPFTLKHTSEVKDLALKTFSRLRSLPRSLVSQATASMQQAELQMMALKSAQYTVATAYDVPHHDDDSIAELERQGELTTTSLDFEQKQHRNLYAPRAKNRKDRSTFMKNLFGRFRATIPGNESSDKRATGTNPKDIPGELHRGHFFPYLGKGLTKDCFANFDITQDGTVTFQEFLTGFLNGFSAFRSLEDNESCYLSVSNTVYYLEMAIFIFIGLIVSLSIWDVRVASVLVPLGSIILILSFAIRTNIQKLVSSLVFVMAVRPFDVGDRVASDSIYDHETIVVERIFVWTTLFRRRNGKKFLIPNHILASMSIENHRRSLSSTIMIIYYVSIDTDPAALAKLKDSILEYLVAHPKEWQTNYTFLTQLVNPAEREMRLQLRVTHHFGWQESMEVWSSYSALTLYVAAKMRKLGITYELPLSQYEIERK